MKIKKLSLKMQIALNILFLIVMLPLDNDRIYNAEVTIPRAAALRNSPILPS